MNKKGFTLIEIIICISLIIIISTSTFVAIKLNNSKNDIENINNTIKNALDVYLNVYKDSDGDKYIDGINNGGKGLYIGLKTLVNVGLLEQDIITILEKEYNKQEKDLKIFVSNSIKTNEDILCENNLIEYTFSWDTDTTSPMYLCPKNTDITSIDGSSDNVKDYIIKTNSNNEPEKLELTNDNINEHYYFYIYTPSAATTNEMITTKENGLFYREVDEKIYYYRGNVDNNYLFINSSNAVDDKKYRIVSLTDNYIKVITEDSINTYYFTLDNLKTFNIEKINERIAQEMYGGVLNYLLYYNISNYIFNISFCNQVNEQDVYYPYFVDESCNGDKNNTRSYGLLTAYEAIYAGVPNRMYWEQCSFLNSSECYPNVVDSDNWLSTGDKTILETKYNSSYVGLGTGVYLNDDKEGYYWTNGVFVKTDNLSQTKINDAIRPVIVFDISKFTISGNGTKQQPYILAAKKLN